MLTRCIFSTPLVKKRPAKLVRAIQNVDVAMVAQAPVQQSIVKTAQFTAPSVSWSFDDDTNDRQLREIVLIGQAFVTLSMAGFVFYYIYQTLNRGNFMSKFTKSSHKIIDPDDVGTDVTFDDVAGIDYAKSELQEIVEFLTNPEKYAKVGAKIPKGCLLVSPPGCGKTLLARAISNEAGVPFIYTSASEFVELFVGVGSSRIRDIFHEAKENSPCIIFIDEIDTIGKVRGNSSQFGGSDEREQTINQLLVEMDGFDSTEGIVVIGATNRADVLDKALLRPGRFDRTIIIDLPDVKGREKILEVHTRDKPLGEDINLSMVSKKTSGFSGAELENLANEAAINAARGNRESLAMADFDNAFDRIVIGATKSGRIVTSKQKRIIAIHEAGHVVVALNMHDFDEISKVSILGRGSSGGITMFLPSDEALDAPLYSYTYLKNQIIVALGGRAAEELIMGKSQVTIGASSDLRRVYDIAHAMISTYGFSDVIGNVCLDGSQVSLLTERLIEKEVIKLVNDSYKRATLILEDNQKQLSILANALIEKETLTKDEIGNLLSKS
jgi:cell division protease FtsH